MMLRITNMNNYPIVSKTIDLITTKYIKQALKESKTFEKTISDSTTNIIIEPMTDIESKNLTIQYSFHQSYFGQCIVASTSKGICNILFCENEETGLLDLISRWNSHTIFTEKENNYHTQILDFQNNKELGIIKLHLKGNDFEHRVWRELLNIGLGRITNYGSIAMSIGQPKMSRMVGKAISNNPIAYLIPCHRVVQSTGAISGYRWGINRKKVILGWEANQLISQKLNQR